MESISKDTVNSMDLKNGMKKAETFWMEKESLLGFFLVMAFNFLMSQKNSRKRMYYCLDDLGKYYIDLGIVPPINRMSHAIALICKFSSICVESVLACWATKKKIWQQIYLRWSQEAGFSVEHRLSRLKPSFPK